MTSLTQQPKKPARYRNQNIVSKTKEEIKSLKERKKQNGIALKEIDRTSTIARRERRSELRLERLNERAFEKARKKEQRLARLEAEKQKEATELHEADLIANRAMAGEALNV